MMVTLLTLLSIYGAVANAQGSDQMDLESPYKTFLDDTSKKEMLEKQTDTKSLQMLNEQYKKGQKYFEQLKILDLLMPRLPKDMSIQLDYIEAQMKAYYHPQPTLQKKKKLQKKLNTMIKNHPNHQRAYWILFDVNHYYIEWSYPTEFYNKDDALQNLEVVRSIKKRFGDTGKTSKYLCQYLVRNHFYQEAPKPCQKAKELNPNDPETLIYSDFLLKNQDQTKLLQILKKFPQSTRVYITAGNLFFDQKKYSLSYKFFTKALSLDDQSFIATLGVARSLFYDDKPGEALQHYVKACQMSVFKARNFFQKAKSILNQKNLFKVASRYQYQINRCINSPTNINL